MNVTPYRLRLDPRIMERFPMRTRTVAARSPQ